MIAKITTHTPYQSLLNAFYADLAVLQAAIDTNTLNQTYFDIDQITNAFRKDNPVFLLNAFVYNDLTSTYQALQRFKIDHLDLYSIFGKELINIIYSRKN